MKNHKRAKRNLKETMRCELVIEEIKIQQINKRTVITIGCFQIRWSRNGFRICMADKSNIKPNKRGSVGKKSPKLWLNSSILTESGVKNAMAKKSFSV